MIFHDFSIDLWGHSILHVWGVHSAAGALSPLRV